MDNLKSPANAYCAQFNGENTENFNGFTKLELAALMIAQGMLSGWWNDGLSEGMRQSLAKDSVAAAKAIIEEANK